MSRPYVTGFIEDAEGIKPDPLVIQHMFNGSVPTTKNALKTFLTRIRHYRHMIPNYAITVQPLRVIYCNPEDISITMTYLIHVNKAYTSLSLAEPLAPWNGRDTVYLSYQIFNTHYNAVLKTNNQGNLKIIAYDSEWFTDPYTTQAQMSINFAKLVQSLCRLFTRGKLIIV